MKPVLKYLVVPFRFGKGQYIQTQMREAKSEQQAVALAEALSSRYAGVIAFEVYVYPETGEVNSPRELAIFGSMPENILEALAA